MSFLQIVLLAILASMFVTTEASALIKTIGLSKRKLPTFGCHGRTFVHFEDLHSRFFWEQPAARTRPTKIIERYPSFVFWNQKPLFKAHPTLGLSESELKKAYNTFGKVHVADAAQQHFITIMPDFELSEGAEHDWKYKFADKDLEKLVKQKAFIDKHFGADAAIAAFGWHLDPLKIDRSPEKWFGDGPSKVGRSGESSYEKHWGYIEPDTNFVDIRKDLNANRRVSIPGTDGESALKLFLHADGSIHPSITGKLQEAARDLSAHSASTLIES